MTFKVTVKDGQTGQAIGNAVVSANVQETGATFSRFTDGSGYADVALLADAPVGADVTFTVQAPGYANAAQYLTVTEENQIIEVPLVPFG